MVDRDRVLAEAARRLHDQQHVARRQRRDDDVPVIDVQLPRRRTPVRLDALAEVVGQAVEPAVVAVRGDPDRVAGQLFLGEPVRVLPAGVDQGVDQRVPVLRGDAGQAPHVPADVIARLGHRAHQRHRTGRGVEPDGVADAGVLGRVRRDHQHDPLVRVRDVPQPGVPHRDAGDPGGALGVGHVDRQPVGVELLERERHGDQPPVELRDGDLGRDVERGQPLIAVHPALPAGGEAETLQDRDVERSELGDVPRLVVAARGRTGGLRATGGEHGDDHGVRGAQGAQQRGVRLAQRRAVHRQWARSGILDGCAQGLDVGGVPRELLGPVVEDGDDRAVRVVGGAVEDPPRRQLDGRVEPLPGEQQRVGEEGVQLREVVRAALREVRVRLRGDARGHRRQLHHLGVRGLLAAEHDHRQPRAADGHHTVRPHTGAAEDPDDDDVGLVEQRRQVLGGRAGGVREPVARTRRARRKQISVRCRQQARRPGCP